jgi:hypothetical protein
MPYTSLVSLHYQLEFVNTSMDEHSPSLETISRSATEKNPRLL